MTTLAALRARDAADPLTAWRARFALPEGVVYLDGNSLGPLPLQTIERQRNAVEQQWGRSLIRGWNDHDWIGAPRRVGAKIARLIGARDDEVIVADSTSVNLFKLIVAAARLRPDRSEILVEAGNFPTDRHIAEGAADLLGGTLRAAPAEDVAAAIGPATAVVVLTHVHYKSGARHDMAALTATARDHGALLIWDLSHSAGAVELDLARDGVELAVGCGYKYLNGGPGAPAFLHVARHLQPEMRSPLTGWMGHADPFAFGDDWRPAPGIDRFLCGTPPMLSLLALESGVDLWLEADRPALFAKSAELFDLFANLAEGTGLKLASPRAPTERGSHIAFRHPHAFAIVQALIARGVIGDFRAPDIARFGLTPLYLSREDIWNAAAILGEVMETEAWRAPDYQSRGRVT